MRIGNYFFTFYGSIVLLMMVPLQELSAQHEHMHDEHSISEDASIGEVDFQVNCSEEVRDDFDRALAMLHNMMYETARDSFEAITDTDPNCAMAHWGISTSLFQPLWGTRPGEKELKQGREHINKAKELVESGRERVLIESTAAFFRESEPDYGTRIRRWTDGVEAAYESYRDDHDIAALYGLTRLAIAQSADEPAPLFDEAEQILRNVFEQAPAHPGAIHYTIHATDADGRAENALDIVEAYGEIAPAVPHALHMPTHIYVRLGEWPKVIDWNWRSAAAALNHPVGDAESHHYLHAIDYLVYAYLQSGEDEKAEELYAEVLQKEKYQASFISAFHFAAIPARLAVEKREWKRAAELEPRTPGYLPWEASPWAEGLTWYAKGLGAVHLGNIESAEKSERELERLRENARDRGASDMATYIETERRVLEGWIEHAKGNNNKAVESMHSAAQLEREIEKHPVTPGALQPPNEALGDLLMDLNRPGDALKAYESSDNIWPGRLNTLTGAALAAKMEGEEQVVREYIGRLLKSGGGPEVEGIAEEEDQGTAGHK